MFPIKRDREEDKSITNKKPTPQPITPPPVIRQPATLGLCFTLWSNHEKIND